MQNDEVSRMLKESEQEAINIINTTSPEIAEEARKLYPDDVLSQAGYILTRE